VYETAPVGKTDQPNFLNAAVQMETELSAAALKDEVLRAIEQELGRVLTQNKNAPRTIDLDISLFNDEVLDAGNRHIPDPEIVQRAYLAWPLADLAPDYRHPETGQTLLQIAQALPDTGLLRRVDLTLELESPQDRKE
jgi:2-amino-4-hydroxy-6-hydroxymethyldihydropteridine diphosphokinase